MKNTTFRKKALLSSIAMLLVAFVALGSATFAWFTQNPTVNADGLSLKATAAAGLQILSDTEKTLGEDYDVATTIKASAIDTTDPNGVTLGTPVSLDCDVTDAVTFRTTQAALETNYAKAGTAGISTHTAGYSEVLWLRSSLDNDEVINVGKASVSITQATSTNNSHATKLYNAIRVTLVDEDGVVIGTWSPDGVANKYLTATSVSDVDYTKAYKTSVEADMDMEVSYDDNSFVTMYVWLDGEDDACCTSNVENLKDLVSTINVKFTTVKKD